MQNIREKDQNYQNFTVTTLEPNLKIPILNFTAAKNPMEKMK
jgi:hypothetical protein